MIDTFTVQCGWTAHEPISGKRSLVLVQNCIRMFVNPDRRTIRWFSCELPRVLFGAKGFVLSTQEEIDAALHKLTLALSEYVEVPPFQTWRISRLDLATQLHLPPALITAHAALSIPGIRSAPTIYNGFSGVSWGKRKSSRLYITLYNKSAQLRLSWSPILRLELSLISHTLKRFLANRPWWDVGVLYKIYRSIATPIPAIDLPKPARNKTELLLAQIDWTPQRIAKAMAQYTHKSKWSRNRLLRQITNYATAQQLPTRFSWKDVLPEHHPPAPAQPKQKSIKPFQRANSAPSTTQQTAHHTTQNPELKPQQ